LSVLDSINSFNTVVVKSMRPAKVSIFFAEMSIVNFPVMVLANDNPLESFHGLASHPWCCHRSPLLNLLGRCQGGDNVIQHCVICRPSDSTVSEDAGIEPRTVAATALTVRRSNNSARSHTHSARSHTHSARSHQHSARSLTSTLG
jgi:hypothetical protein